MTLHPRVGGEHRSYVPRYYPSRYVLDLGRFPESLTEWCDREASSRLCFGLGVWLYRTAHDYEPAPPLKRGCGPWPTRARYLTYLQEECHRMGASYKKAKGPSKTRPEAMARMFAWRRLRAQGYSYPGIGNAANKDWTTIICGMRRLDLLDSLTAFCTALQRIPVDSFQK